MLIEFECPNLLDFDKEQKQYVTCGAKLIASDDKIGELIHCEKCSQSVEVPYTAFSKPQSEKKKKRRQPVSSEKNASSDSSGELKLSDPVARPTSDVMTYDFEEEEASQAFQNNEVRCPKCGNSLDDFGNCSSCRYIKPTYESQYTPLNKLKLKPAGFQKWCIDMMSEGMPLPVICGIGHVLAILFFGAMLLVSFFIERPNSVLLAIAATAGGLLYAAFVFKAYQLSRNPRARLAWFQRPLWNGILSIARSRKWTGYDPSIDNRHVIDLRGQGVVNEKVLAQPGLKKSGVLDLEGTLVTDQLLPELYGLKYLQCVVLRKTKVTHEAVIRLQQANPRLWIWY